MELPSDCGPFGSNLTVAYARPFTLGWTPTDVKM
jgi:hypothetical protein